MEAQGARAVVFLRRQARKSYEYPGLLVARASQRTKGEN